MTFPNDQSKPGGATPSYLTAQQSALHVDGPPRIIKTGAGTVVSMNVLAAGAPGAIYDCSTTGAIATGNQVGIIPATQGPVSLQFPCLVGICVAPGAGQVVSVAYT